MWPHPLHSSGCGREEEFCELDDSRRGLLDSEDCACSSIERLLIGFSRVLLISKSD